MQKEMLYCDQCDHELGEKGTDKIENIISIDHNRESNIWFGPISKWGQGLLIEEDLTFCTWACFVNYLTQWYLDNMVIEEDE